MGNTYLIERTLEEVAFKVVDVVQEEPLKSEEEQKEQAQPPA